MRDQLGYATIAILGSIRQGNRFGLDIMRATSLPGGTVYPTLSRAERSGLVRSRWEDRATADKGRRPRRRFYQLTSAGETALARAVERADAVTTAARLAMRKARA